MAKGQRVAAEDRRNQILEVAASQFALHGFGGTTTRTIAARAHVNEAIIFRHFASKEELYREVLEKMTREKGASAYVRKRLAAGGELRQVLLEATAHVLESSTQDDKLTRLFFYAVLESHELSRKFFRTQVMQGYRLFLDYVQQQMDMGSLRNGNGASMARTYCGMVVQHILMHNLLAGEKQFTPDPREAAELLVDTWLHGVLPEDSPLRLAAGRRSRRRKSSHTR